MPSPVQRRKIKLDARDVKDLVLEKVHGQLKLAAQGASGQKSHLTIEGDVAVRKEGAKLTISGTGKVTGSIHVARGANLLVNNAQVQTKNLSGEWGRIQHSGGGFTRMSF